MLATSCVETILAVYSRRPASKAVTVLMVGLSWGLGAIGCCLTEMRIPTVAAASIHADTKAVAVTGTLRAHKLTKAGSEFRSANTRHSIRVTSSVASMVPIHRAKS